MLKKLLCLCSFALVLTGCTAASADTEYSPGDFVVTEVSLEEGYYLSDKDDSYVHIVDGQIELCNYDYITICTEQWNAIEGDKVSLEESIAIFEESFLPQCELQEYTPLNMIGMGENGGDQLFLSLDYEWSKESGAYNGYLVYDDGTLSKAGNIYTYFGTELPETNE